MSLGARATKGGGRGKEKHGQEKGKVLDKPQPKEKVKPQATTEQIRMANMIDRKSDDASDVRQKVVELMEMTCRTEEEVCSALHDADNDLVIACNLLLETTRIQGEWQTREKKKKKPPASAPGPASPEPPPRDPPARPAARSRRGEGAGGRGRWAGRGRGAGRGAGRGGGGAGGGGPGGGGARGRPLRRHHAPDHAYSNNVDDGPAVGGDSFPATEDWDNEEWSGSLNETKVFTPSVKAQPPQELEAAPLQNNTTEDWETGESNGGHEHIQTYNYHELHTQQHNMREQQQPVVQAASQELPAQDNYHANHHHQPMGMSGSLSAAQSQYLSQLTQRRDDSMYSTNYGVYGGTELSAQRKQRAIVPPPSKIPALAVEMPLGMEAGGGLLDVTFGALDPAALRDAQQPAPAPAPAPAPEPAPVVESAPPPQAPSPAPAPAPATAPAAAPLEKQLTASMKQLSVTAEQPAVTSYSQHHHQYTHHNNKAALSASAYGGGVSHAPLYPPAALPPQQLSSTNSSVTAGVTAAYPSTQYQPIINSYQQATGTSGVYGNSALYTQYAPPANKLPHKDSPQQYEAVASLPAAPHTTASSTSSNTNTTNNTNTSTTKAAPTTAVSSASSVSGHASYPALYQPGYSHYDDMRPHTTHHMTGYYEVGYGGREGSFGLGAGDRFARRDNASPQQQVPAALPPGYAYFYQPPPTTYQYGVYPTYGGTSGVGGPGGVAGAAGGVQPKVSSYTPQQPPYDAQDSYKQASAYSGGGAGKAAAAAAADLTGAIYAKQQLALNKLNSYEKATFHSGTPPPFGAASHLYIPAHHHPHHQHQHHQHQMDVRLNSSHARRAEPAGAGGPRPSSNSKPSNKPAYSQSYWPSN